MDFKDFILNEMARVLRQPISMDKADIAYLKQFPKYFWKQAMTARYGPLLINALDDRGRIKPDWNDIQSIQLKGGKRHGSVTFPNIKTYISPLITKLKNMGYDLEDPDIVSNTGMFHNFLKKQAAGRHISKWVQHSGGGLEPEKQYKYLIDKSNREFIHRTSNPKLKSGFTGFNPNKLEKSRNDFDYGDPQGDKIWSSIKQDATQEAYKYFQSNLTKISKEENKYHINYYYWSDPSKSKELINDAIKYIQKNIKDPNILERPRRAYLLQNFYSSAFQRGLVNRRRIETSIEKGLSPNFLIKKYGPHKAAEMLNLGTDTPVAARQMNFKNPRADTIEKKRNLSFQQALKTGRSSSDVYKVRMEFKTYFIESSQEDVKNTIDKLPPIFRKLAKQYQIKFENGHTLKGDKKNIGFIDEKNKTITLASPWNYPREYTLLHEIGHIIWKYVISKENKEKWSKIVKTTKNKQNQNDEELFCMAFADYYAHHKILIHHHEEWAKFIKSIESKNVKS